MRQGLCTATPTSTYLDSSSSLRHLLRIAKDCFFSPECHSPKRFIVVFQCFSQVLDEVASCMCRCFPDSLSRGAHGVHYVRDSPPILPSSWPGEADRIQRTASMKLIRSGFTLAFGRLQHQHMHEVVNQAVDGQFLSYALHCFALECSHLQRRFQLCKVCFHPPANVI